jgi:hypothetical protein
MTTRQFLYEDDSLSSPPSVTGLPDGYALFTNDGHLHVVRSGAWVDITPAGGGGGGGGTGNGNLIVGTTALNDISAYTDNPDAPAGLSFAGGYANEMHQPFTLTGAMTVDSISWWNATSATVVAEIGALFGTNFYPSGAAPAVTGEGKLTGTFSTPVNLPAGTPDEAFYGASEPGTWAVHFYQTGAATSPVEVTNAIEGVHGLLVSPLPEALFINSGAGSHSPGAAAAATVPFELLGPVDTGAAYPPSDIGNAGDYFLDVTTPGAFQLYGPKTGSTWPTSGEITSGTGTVFAGSLSSGANPDNSIGQNGDWFIDFGSTPPFLHGPKTSDDWSSSGDALFPTSPFASVLPESGTVTMDSTYGGQVVDVSSSSPSTFTLPTGVPSSYGIFHCQFDQTGTGAVTITAAAGVTINGVDSASHTITAQWESVFLRQLASGGDNYILTGSFA